MYKKSSTNKNNRRRSGKSRNSRSTSARNKVFKSIEWASKTNFSGESVSSLELLENSIGDTDFIVFDIETTGGNPERNGITEFYGVKYKNGEKSESFYSMVNPQVPIPRIVRKMTGITNAMVKDAPKISEIIDDLIKFIGDSVLVSHNTIGDLKFLRHFAFKCANHNLNNFFLCTHLLSEKLISDAPDKSLKGLCQYLDIENEDSHRAEADTDMTLGLFQTLEKRLKESKGITRLKDAVKYQGDLESSIRLGWGVEEAQLKKAPSTPGLFYLYDNDDNLVFMSSSLNVSKDVRSLVKYHQLPKQLLRKVLNTKRIETKSTSNYLEAFYLEANDARASNLHYPPYNWHMRSITVIQAHKQGDKYLVSVGRPELDAEFLFGKVYDRKEAGKLVGEIAEALGVESTRRGFTVDKQGLELVRNVLSKNLSDMEVGLNRQMWNPLSWIIPSKRKSASLERSHLDALKHLEVPAYRDLKSVDGFVVHGERYVSASKATHIEIYPVKNGFLQPPTSFKGDFQQWSQTDEGLKKVALLDQSVVGSQESEGCLNAGLWLSTSRPKKEEADYRFYTYPFPVK